MPYSLSFTPEFFWGRIALEEVGPTDQPTSIYQALVSLDDETWTRLAHEVFGVDEVEPLAAMEKVIQTDTCANLDSPVEVFVDPEGAFSLFVFEETP